MSIQRVGKCINCNLCRLCCPQKAITFEENELGFIRPRVDQDKCNECGICEKYCIASGKEAVQSLKSAYYGRSKNPQTLKVSSSGGIFSEIAEVIIKDGGVVFGAVYDYNGKSVIFGSSDNYPLDEIRRSKYVESDVKDTYIQIKKQLETGRKVLFVGAPCQAWGLKTYLKKEYENLVCCDFICGGMPPKGIFKEYLTNLEKRYKDRVTAINFRTKFYGWSRIAIEIKFSNGKIYRNHAYLDPFFRGFMIERILLREECYECKFSTNHCSDIILADFWGYRQIPDFKNDEKGCSLVVTNSDKGEEMISRLSGADLEKIPLEYAMYNFKEKKINKDVQKKREEFFKEFRESGFEKSAKKIYMKNCNMFRIKRLVGKMIGKN